MNKILEINNLKKSYHTKKSETLAVDNFSYSLSDGEFIAIVGPSGCGKSTILSILCGLESKSDGEVITHSLTEESKQKVIDLLSTYGLKDFIYSYPDELSGGMRQRVALIRTLAMNPDILLLDEPFSALDYQTRLAVSDDVYKIIKQEKKSAIIVTHDLSEAISMADKVIVLSERPSRIKKIFDINLSNKSTPIENRKTKEFSEYYDKIWKEIDFHV